jgi:hypothetical protein
MVQFRGLSRPIWSNFFSRNETPNPKVRHVSTWRIRKKESCAAVGSGKGGGSEVDQRIGHTTMAGTAAMRVTAASLEGVKLLQEKVP